MALASPTLPNEVKLRSYRMQPAASGTNSLPSDAARGEFVIISQAWPAWPETYQAYLVGPGHDQWTRILGTECWAANRGDAKWDAVSTLVNDLQQWRTRIRVTNAPVGTPVPSPKLRSSVQVAVGKLRQAQKIAVAEQLVEIDREAKDDGGDLWFDDVALSHAVSVVIRGILDSRYPSVVLGPALDGSVHARWDSEATGEMLNLVFQPDGRVWFFITGETSVDSGTIPYAECESFLQEVAQTS